jgi:hypothetical protein
MSTQYFCNKPRRRALVLEGSSGKPVINGIDYLEVAPLDQTTLSVHFLFPLPGQPGAVPPGPAPALTAANLMIEGGVRVTGITVKSISASDRVLTVTVNSATPKIVGDFSTYTLMLVDSPTNPAAPAGFDPQLSSVDFSFKVECPSDFDCQQAAVCPPPVLPAAAIDYLAKDYASFLQLIFDRMALIMPDWQERHSADTGIALVELLAYAGDQLSYYQDAVATEAYLGTARQRISVRRHARLLDYFMHDGCNSRAWVFFKAGPGSSVLIPAQSLLLTQTSAPRGLLAEAQVSAANSQGAQAFQTLVDITVHPALNELDFYTWSDEQCCLPFGATTATLRDNGAGARLKTGDALLFEEVLGAATGFSGDADPGHRQVVRLTQVALGHDPLDNTPVVEIAWDPADALGFPLCLSAIISNPAGSVAVSGISVARGNIVLADYGTNQPVEILPPLPAGPGLYRPQLEQSGLTFAVPYDDLQSRTQPAAGILVQDPRQALPAITLGENGSAWSPVRDLLASGSNARDFVVEMENDGTARLRFGDGILGSPPLGGLAATYRTGNGSAGNVGAEAIANVVGTAAVPLTGIVNVRNPLPAQGGVDGETLDQVRFAAPWAFRTQQRAVTVADYSAVAERHPEVKKAQATLRWTGSWYTMFVTVDRVGGQPVDDAFRATIRGFLEQFRLAGYDLEVDAPVFIPLDIAFTVCVTPRYFRSAVAADLLDVFSNRVLPTGQAGFFDPDNFTFGQPVYLSRVIAAAMAVPGVAWVDTNDVPPAPNYFKRWGKASQGETAAGRIPMARLEIARLDNDPSAPENGRIAFFMEGGS